MLDTPNEVGMQEKPVTEETKPPLVSVIIPAFNAQAFLTRTVQSVQRQELTDLEILIIDDASEDGTLAEATTLAAEDPRIRVFASERNGGPAVARNRGLAEAKGNWIALLDADDAFEPTRLSQLLGLARDCDADLMADNLLLVDEAGDEDFMLPVSEVASCGPVSAADFLRGNLPDPRRPRKSYGFLKPVISRRFLEAHGLRYDESLRFAEDFAFYLACLAAGGRFFLCQEPLYRYRLRANSLTATHTAEDLRRLQNVDQRFLKDSRTGKGDFRAALRLHKRTIDQRLQWRVFIQEVKKGSWVNALLASLKGWHVFGYVIGQLSAELWRRRPPRRFRSTAA